MTNETPQNGWTLNTVLEATGGRLLGKVGEVGEKPISGISTDSRTLRQGELFVALVGENFDGHLFIDEAVNRGAAGVLVALEGSEVVDVLRLQIPLVGVMDTLRAFGDLAGFWRSRFHVPVVAITGSNGKTTTKEMVAAILAGTWRVLKSQGTFNNLVGLPYTLLQLNRTHEAVVVELGMNQPGEIQRLTEIVCPDLGLITNVQPAHLQGLGSLEGIRAAKGELFAGMAATATIVVNRDDPNVVALASSFPGRQVGFSVTDSAAEVFLERTVSMDAHGSRFLLRLGREIHQVHLQLIGHHQLNNSVAAAAVAWALELPADTIIQVLEEFRPIDKRMQVLTLPGDIHIINDTYNANPGSMSAALETLMRVRQPGRGLAALGDMLELGEESGPLHREVGRVAAREGVSHLLAMGGHGSDLLEGAAESGMGDQCLTRARDHKDLALKLLPLLTAGDWVLVKGSRGMRMEKVVEELSELLGNSGESTC